MVTFEETIANISADLERRCLLEGKPYDLWSGLSIVFKLGVISVILYRFSRYIYFSRFRSLCRLITIFEQLVVRNVISPLADIGPGLVFADGGGIGISPAATIGKNCTFLGCQSITLGAMDQYDVNRDRIMIGDYCVFGPRIRLMRPLVLGNATQIKANAVVLFSSEVTGGVLSGIPAKRRSVESYEDVIRWNPLMGGLIHEVQS